MQAIEQITAAMLRLAPPIRHGQIKRQLGRGLVHPLHGFDVALLPGGRLQLVTRSQIRLDVELQAFEPAIGLGMAVIFCKASREPGQDDLLIGDDGRRIA